MNNYFEAENLLKYINVTNVLFIELAIFETKQFMVSYVKVNLKTNFVSGLVSLDC